MFLWGPALTAKNHRALDGLQGLRTCLDPSWRLGAVLGGPGASPKGFQEVYLRYNTPVFRYSWGVGAWRSPVFSR